MSSVMEGGGNVTPTPPPNLQDERSGGNGCPGKCPVSSVMVAVAQRQWLGLVRDPKVLRPLFLSMPHRLNAVIACKGGFTKY